MFKGIVGAAALIVILGAAALVPEPARAGASASAPSKYSQANAGGYQVFTRWWRIHRSNGTSEYSSKNSHARR